MFELSDQAAGLLAAVRPMRDDLNDNARARVGTAITSKYRIVRFIGCGGMAAVYEGAHRNGHPVAIKILHPHLSMDSDLRTRFSREGYAANKVRHRGAVQVIDDDVTDDGAAFLAMELLEGETLDGRLRGQGDRRGLPLHEVSAVGIQLLDVLAAAHDAGIIHRDIKPENLFLTSEGVVKVLDFGIARLREANDMENVTRTGRLMGTPAFMAPEQALGHSKQIDPQTDLWAVGATLFTLASDCYVHEAETAQEMLVNSASRPARSLLAVVPDAAVEIAAVVDRALAFDKTQRWPDARTMQAALVEAHRIAFGTTLPLSPVPGSGVHLAGAAAASTSTSAPFADIAPHGASSQVRAVSTTAGLAHLGESRPAERGAMWRPRGAHVGGAVMGLVVVAAAASFVTRKYRVANTTEPDLAPSVASFDRPRDVDGLEKAGVAGTSSLTGPVQPQATTSSIASPSQPPTAAPPAPSRHHAAHTSPASPEVSQPTPVLETTHPTPPAPSASAAGKTCRAVSFFDSQGQKHFKLECQ